MLSDEFPEVDAVGPKVLKGTAVVLTVYVDKVDQVVAKAVKAGAKVRRAVADQFYGDRTGQIEDPFGHVWSIQSRVEKVSPKDMQKRLNALLKTEASAAVARRSTTGGDAKAARGKKAAKPSPVAPAKKAATRKAPMRKAAARKSAAKPSVAARASNADRKVNRVGRPKKAAKKST
jgi:hypothetical protein